MVLTPKHFDVSANHIGDKQSTTGLLANVGQLYGLILGRGFPFAPSIPEAPCWMKPFGIDPGNPGKAAPHMSYAKPFATTSLYDSMLVMITATRILLTTVTTTMVVMMTMTMTMTMTMMMMMTMMMIMMMMIMRMMVVISALDSCVGCFWCPWLLLWCLP